MSGYWDTYPYLQNDLSRVRTIMRDTLKSGTPVLSDVMEKLLSRQGKMLRPAFVLLGARMKPYRSGGFPARKSLPDKIYTIAAAVEIMHLATLVHDDVIDKADYRRGMPSLNATSGDRNAVLVGDYLFSRCFSLIADNATMENARYLAKVVSHICESEISQSLRFHPDTLSVRNYFHRIIGKTAILFALSLHTGASENKVPGGVVSVLRRIGYNVGLAFQITDDLLDFTGTPERLGKPAGGDLREGIYTLPVIYAANCGQVNLRPLLTKDNLEKPENFFRVMERITMCGSFEKTRKTAAAYTGRALRETDRLPVSENRDALAAVIRSLLDREY